MDTIFWKSGIVAIAFVVTGCGGGGGGGSSPAPSPQAPTTQSFPFESGHKARVANGSSTTYDISGYCTGTLRSIWEMPIPGTFEGTPALAVDVTEITTITSGSCARGTATATIYYDMNYVPLGTADTSDPKYGVYTPIPIIPASVRVGDSGSLGTQLVYSDSTKAHYIGKHVYTYVVEPDTATTAIINIITKSYPAIGTLAITEEDRRRIVSNGTMTPVSIDRMDAQGNSLHLKPQ